MQDGIKKDINGKAKQTNVLNINVSRETTTSDSTSLSDNGGMKARKSAKAEHKETDKSREARERYKLEERNRRKANQAQKRRLEDEQKRLDREKHEQDRLRREQEKQNIKVIELKRLKNKAGLEDLQVLPDEEKIPECPTASELYKRFRRNKLSVVESAYNSLYLYCNDKYYSSDVAIREKYKNIYAHPNSWFQNHVGMWKHNRWSVAVKLLEIIPFVKRFNNKLLHIRTRFNGKVKNLLRHFEYSHVAVRSMGRFFAKITPILLICAGTAAFVFLTARSIYFQPALELYIDGKFIGNVDSITSVESAQRAYEESVSINLGRTYRLNCNVDYKPTVINDGKELAQNSMIDAFEKASETYMENGYGLYVDGILVCAAPYKAWIDDTINDSLEDKKKALANSGADIQNVDYYNDMSVTAGTFPSGLMMNLMQIRELFSLEPITDEDYAKFTKITEEGFNGKFRKLTTEKIKSKSRSAENGDKTVLTANSEVLPDNTTTAVVADVASDTGNAVSPKETTLDVVVQKTEEVTEEIPFETENYDNAEMLEGKSVISTKGVNGSKNVTYSVSYIGGKEVERTAVSEVITKEPITQVVIIGTRQMSEEEKRTMSHGTYIWPFRGKVSSEYSWRLNGSHNEFHKGMDICGKMGDDIMASDGGEVTFADWDKSGYGYCILIHHDDGTVTRYAHCSELYVEKGQRVGQGEVIAAMGETGNASGVHVHFEVISGGKAQNPRNYLEE